MKRTYRTVIALALLVLAIVATAKYAGRVTAFAASTSSSAIQDTLPIEEQTHFAMFGIARGQTARINAVNIADPNDHDGGDPIEVLLKFEDGEGNIVARKIQTLIPGHSTSLDMTIDPGRANRVAVVPSIGARIGPCNKVLGTVEVYDSSNGRTVFAIGSEVRFVVAPTAR